MTRAYFTAAIYHLVIKDNSMISVGIIISIGLARLMSTSSNYPPTTCTSLVAYGSNLGSTVGTRISKLVRNMTVLPFHILGVVVGVLLSDAWLQREKSNWNARLGFKQSVIHFEYLWFVFSLLSHYCSNMPYSTKSQVRGKIHFGVVIFTRAYPCFTELYRLFYPNGVKVVPQDIYNLLTPIALAHWILGDGAVRNKGLTLCTDNFTVPEVVLLMSVLMIRYDLKCTLHFNEDKPRIYIGKASLPKLVAIVSPYIIPAMMYKIQL
jgi:LAGLIDADG DNA endonuclease family